MSVPGFGEPWNAANLACSPKLILGDEEVYCVKGGSSKCVGERLGLCLCFFMVDERGLRASSPLSKK